MSFKPQATILREKSGVKIDITYRPSALGGFDTGRGNIIVMLDGKPLNTCSNIKPEIGASGTRVTISVFVGRDGNGEVYPSDKWLSECGCVSMEIVSKVDSFVYAELTWIDPELSIKPFKVEKIQADKLREKVKPL